MHEPRHGSALQFAAARLFACGGWVDDGDSSTATEVYDPSSDSWQPIPPQAMSVECRFWAADGVLAHQCTSASPACAHSSGLSPLRRPELRPRSCQVSATVECFDPIAGTWQQMPPMIEARTEAATAAVGGNLYVCGGFASDRKPLRSFERWVPAICAWERLPPMAEGRALAVARACGECLLVCGGVGYDGKPLSSTESFNTQLGEWTLWRAENAARPA